MMGRNLRRGLMLALVLSIGLPAQSAQDFYQRGLVQEHAYGNLQAAIELYAQAAKAANGDRALAAHALIRLASSYEKLGADADAERTFAEVVRAYPEQRDQVSIAEQRLLKRGSAARSTVTSALERVDRVDDAELAARLAALLWNGAPDAALEEAVRGGELRDAAALNRHVGRMLNDQRSANLVDGFFVPWLSLDRLKGAQPDPSVFPQFDAALRQAMETETRLFLHSQLREDRDALELWTADYTFVNERLGRHYGLSGVGGEQFRRITWPDARRAGLLGQAGPLTMLSSGSRTSPTARGVYVLTRFLGMDAPSPPANIPPLADQPGAQTASMRERMMAHRTNPSCANCHQLFDPFGLALENFDATGAWRSSEGGLTIDASGSFADGTRFDGPAGLRAALVKHRDAYYTNVTRRLLAYALGRKGPGWRVYDHEMPAVRAIVRDASAGGYRWSSIFAGITASAPFQMRNRVP